MHGIILFSPFFPVAVAALPGIYIQSNLIDDYVSYLFLFPLLTTTLFQINPVLHGKPAFGNLLLLFCSLA